MPRPDGAGGVVFEEIPSGRVEEENVESTPTSPATWIILRPDARGVHVLAAPAAKGRPSSEDDELEYFPVNHFLTQNRLGRFMSGV